MPLGRLVEDQVVAVRAGVSELRLDLGAVHDARVALRRLRATLSVFRPVLDDVPASLTGDLRWFAGQVAATRDAEVATDRLAAQLIGHLARSSDHAAAAVLEDHLGRWTAEAAVAARASLADPRTDQLLQGLGRLHLQASKTPQIYLETRTQRLVVRTLEDLCDDLPVALAANGLTRGRHARVLHAQRKKVKAARAVTGVLDVTAEQRGRLDKALRAVQELLGEHHGPPVVAGPAGDPGAGDRRAGPGRPQVRAGRDDRDRGAAAACRRAAGEAGGLGTPYTCCSPVLAMMRP